MAHSSGENFQKPAGSEINKAPSTDNTNNVAENGRDQPQADKGSIQAASNCSKIEITGIMDHQSRQTKKLLKKQADAIYNPNKDLWRHGIGCSISISESPGSNPSPCGENSNPDRERLRVPNRNSPRANSFHEQRHRESSYYMDLPKARDSLQISQPAPSSGRSAGSFFMRPPKARDSLRINQPASSQTSFSKPQVQFEPQVQFAKSPDKNMNNSGSNGYPAKKSLGMPQSPHDIASAVGDEVISNLISAWYWTGYYAGYTGSVSEE